MSLNLYYTITSYALIATSFAALALTGELDAVAIVCYPLVLGLCLYRDARETVRRGLPEWMWRTLAVLYIPFFFIDAIFVSNKVLALVHLTLFLSAAKLCQNKRDRDWVFLYLVAFFQMLLAAGLTFDTTFIASLVAFIFFFISTLAAFEIRRTYREIAPIEDEIITPSNNRRRLLFRAKDGSSPAKRKSAGRVRYLIGASIGQVVIVAALTFPLFFLIPRFGGGGVARGWGEGQSLTGFSDTVRLGEVAEIKESNRVVMRVQLAGKPGRYLRWRGIALDNYDGRSWSIKDRHRRIFLSDQRVRRSGETWSDDEEAARSLPVSNATGKGASLLEQRIVLEPVKTNFLFAANRLVWVRGPISQLFITRDTDRKSADGSVAVMADSLKGRTAYVALSDISLPSEQELRADSPVPSDNYPDDIREFYLQQPRRLDPRIAQLARDITREARTPYDKARAMEGYLKTRFGYTLDLKPAKADPLAEFLFDMREGHCEYFATAMAIMLRTLGIPARVVNGFQMGEYNDINNAYTVRDRDAHSWVEVYFPQTNSWVEFDPTPSAGINDYSQGGLLAGLWKYIEAAEVLWLDYVVTLDSDEQASLMVEIQQHLLSIKNKIVAHYNTVRVWVKNLVASYLVTGWRWSAGDVLKLMGALGVLSLSLLVSYVAVAHVKRRRLEPTGYGPWWHRLFILPRWKRARASGGDHRASAVLFYEQMLAIASRTGLVKNPDQTPMEFADISGFDQIREITSVYNRVRFGGASLNEREIGQISNLLAELKKAVRRAGNIKKTAKRRSSRT